MSEESLASRSTSHPLLGTSSRSSAELDDGGSVSLQFAAQPNQPTQRRTQASNVGITTRAAAGSFRTSNAFALQQVLSNPADPDIEQRDACLEDGIHLKECLDSALGCLQLKKLHAGSVYGSAEEQSLIVQPCAGILRGGIIPARRQQPCSCTLHSQYTCSQHGFVAQKQQAGFTVLSRRLGQQGNLDWVDLQLPYPRCAVTLSDLCQPGEAVSSSHKGCFPEASCMTSGHGHMHACVLTHPSLPACTHTGVARLCYWAGVGTQSPTPSA
jgi:hypothetical protein